MSEGYHIKFYQDYSNVMFMSFFCKGEGQKDNSAPSFITSKYNYGTLKTPKRGEETKTCQHDMAT